MKNPEILTCKVCGYKAESIKDFIDHHPEL